MESDAQFLVKPILVKNYPENVWTMDTKNIIIIIIIIINYYYYIHYNTTEQLIK